MRESAWKGVELYLGNDVLGNETGMGRYEGVLYWLATLLGFCRFSTGMDVCLGR